jgi:hypothetical protein
MTTKQTESEDRFDAGRVKRARADIEETVQGLRQRQEPSAFAVKYAPQLAEAAREYQKREDRRIADERAGNPTKPFAEMEGIEVFFAMASYPGPGHYPADLEVIAQEMAERPVPALSAADEEALREVISLGQRLQAGERETWIVDRLSALAEHPTPSVRVAAMGVSFQLAEEDLSEGAVGPEPKGRRGEPQS